MLTAGGYRPGCAVRCLIRLYFDLHRGRDSSKLQSINHVFNQLIDSQPKHEF